MGTMLKKMTKMANSLVGYLVHTSIEVSKSDHKSRISNFNEFQPKMSEGRDLISIVQYF